MATANCDMIGMSAREPAAPTESIATMGSARPGACSSSGRVPLLDGQCGLLVRVDAEGELPDALALIPLAPYGREVVPIDRAPKERMGSWSRKRRVLIAGIGCSGSRSHRKVGGWRKCGVLDRGGWMCEGPEWRDPRHRVRGPARRCGVNRERHHDDDGKD